ncbi:MAG: PIN domain-containing protein [Nanoarchaeota archaeon]|nr:MAG: PIN domain-containing protein [Nanoarchaeota archaeon]
MLIFDTSAWIDYFQGSKRGEKVRAIIESEEKIGTPSIVLFEFAAKASLVGIDVKNHIDFIKQRSSILSLDENLVFPTGKIYAKFREQNKKISLPDCMIIATAERINSKIVTCDLDFKDVNNVLLIK